VPLDDGQAAARGAGAAAGAACLVHACAVGLEMGVFYGTEPPRQQLAIDNCARATHSHTQLAVY